MTDVSRVQHDPELGEVTVDLAAALVDAMAFLPQGRAMRQCWAAVQRFERFRQHHPGLTAVRPESPFEDPVARQIPSGARRPCRG